MKLLKARKMSADIQTIKVVNKRIFRAIVCEGSGEVKVSFELR